MASRKSLRLQLAEIAELMGKKTVGKKRKGISEKDALSLSSSDSEEEPTTLLEIFSSQKKKKKDKEGTSKDPATEELHA